MLLKLFLIACLASSISIFVLGADVQLEPTHYELWLQIDDDNSGIVDGKVDIDLEIYEDVNLIVLNCKNITINEEVAKLIKKRTESDPEKEIPINNMEMSPEMETCRIRLRQTADAGLYQLHLEFSSTLKRTGHEGMFEVEYEKDLGAAKLRRKVILTNFKATHARSVFPCFDEPMYKASIRLTLRHRWVFHALSVMKSISR